MSVNMNEAINQFIKYIENERMYSEYTILNKTNGLYGNRRI